MGRNCSMVLATIVAAIVFAGPVAAQPVSIDCQSDDGKRSRPETFYFSMGGSAFLKDGDLTPHNRAFRQHLETTYGKAFPQAACKVSDSDDSIWVYAEMRRQAGRTVVEIPGKRTPDGRLMAGNWRPEPFPTK